MSYLDETWLHRSVHTAGSLTCLSVNFAFWARTNKGFETGNLLTVCTVQSYSSDTDSRSASQEFSGLS